MTLAVDFSPFSNEPTVVLAVSGGSDSTALMWLAHGASVSNGTSCKFVAATVDHGLRPEAADEARSVGALAATLGIEHRILEWQGDKPSRGIQAAAREARLRLLSQLARELGARVVLTGHTADDQVETVLMRSERGEGIGLAGMAPATLFRGEVWFARPLLGQRRADLCSVLETNNIGWSEDPSNQNSDFERVRVRSRMAKAEDGAVFDDVRAKAGRAASDRGNLSRTAAGLINAFARLVDGTAIRCDANLLDADQAGALHSLRLLIATAACASHLPDLERTAMLIQALREGRGGSLGNARIDLFSGGFTIRRDRRGHSGPPVTLVSPFAELLPSFDLAAAGAIARLLGQPEPTVTPWT